MKVLCLNDIHLDHRPEETDSFLAECARTECDVVSIAGDIANHATLSASLDRIAKAFAPRPVLFVLGNHDYWGGSFSKTIYRAETAARRHKNLFLLENKAITIEGQWFVGTTLWFPFEVLDEPLAAGWPDFHFILDFRLEVRHRNKKAVTFLERNVAPGSFVITHHLPSYGCVAPQYQKDKTNCFYLGGAAHVLMGNRAAVWHYGHTHCGRDEIEADTRVVCNPRGYPNEGTSFNSSFTVEV